MNIGEDLWLSRSWRAQPDLDEHKKALENHDGDNGKPKTRLGFWHCEMS